jgi:hypothetical protein
MICETYSSIDVQAQELPQSQSSRASHAGKALQQFLLHRDHFQGRIGGNIPSFSYRREPSRTTSAHSKLQIKRFTDIEGCQIKWLISALYRSASDGPFASSKQATRAKPREENIHPAIIPNTIVPLLGGPDGRSDMRTAISFR